MPHKTQDSPSTTPRELSLSDKKRQLKLLNKHAQEHFRQAVGYNRSARIALVGQLPGATVTFYKKQARKAHKLSSVYQQQAAQLKQEIRRARAERCRALLTGIRSKIGL